MAELAGLPVWLARGAILTLAVSPVPEERRHGIRQGSPVLSSPAAGQGAKERGEVHVASQPPARVEGSVEERRRSAWQALRAAKGSSGGRASGEWSVMPVRSCAVVAKTGRHLGAQQINYPG